MPVPYRNAKPYITNGVQSQFCDTWLGGLPPHEPSVINAFKLDSKRGAGDSQDFDNQSGLFSRVP